MKYAPTILLMMALLMMAPLMMALPVAASARAHHAGEIFRDARFAPAMVVVPAGHILEGSTEAETTSAARAPALAAFEHPQREVSFSRPFAIGKYHVTKAEFAVFARATKRAMAGCVVAIHGAWSDGPQPAYDYTNAGFPQRGDEPVVCVNWDDAQAYAAWLSAKTGAKYRLPSEDEWEYAARGGTLTARWWGDDAGSLCARVNGGDRMFAAAMPSDTSANTTCSDGFAQTSPVGHFAPNPFGLYDMLGDAWQWMADCFTPVTSAPAPAGACRGRSIRGGSWHNGPASLRAAARMSLPPTMRASSLGFRVVRELP